MEAALKREYYTYADYSVWVGPERWELIDGEVYAMSPGPTWKHQGIVGELFGQLRDFLKGKPCKVFPAPFDVRLNADTADDTVVQPDIVVICDRSIIGGTGCAGSPDMVIEILSPSTEARDRIQKLKLYQKYGIREYWIVDPESKTVSVHILDNGRYYATGYTETETAPVHVLEGCTINLAEVFED